MSDMHGAWSATQALAGAILSLCLLPMIAHASKESEALVSLRNCAALREPARRLACFDQIAAKSLAESPTATPSAHEQATPVREPEARFGLSAEQVRRTEATQSAPPPQLAKLSAHVFQAQRQGNGGWRFTLDNGQVWYQISPSEYLDLSVGSEVVIKPGWLGSYLLVDASGHSANVHRAR